MGKTIEERLRALDVYTDSIEEHAKVFIGVQNQDDFKAYDIGALSAEQFLYFHFNRLVELHPEILDEAEKELGDLGLASDYIREFLTIGADPSYTMSLRCDLAEMDKKPAPDKRYDREARINFAQAAFQFALNKMKEYLGINLQS